MNRLSLFLCSAVIAIPMISHAQPAPTSSANEADVLFQKGNAHYEKKEWALAEAAYEQALAKKQTHDIASNLGYAELRQSKFVEAAEHLTLAARIWPPTVKDDARKKGLLERLASAKKEVVTLKIAVDVRGAKVTVNGAEIGTSPLAQEAFAPPGDVHVEAALAGYEKADYQQGTWAGSEWDVYLRLDPSSPPKATASSDATAAPSENPHLENPHPNTAIVMGGAALSGATLIVGAILLGVAEQTHADLLAKTPKNPDGSPVCAANGTALPICDDFRADARATTTLGQAGIGLLVGGGVVGLATVGYFLLAPKLLQSKPAMPAVVPVVSPTSAGLVWTGAF